MSDSVRPPERVAMVPQVRERSPREEREREARQRPSSRPEQTKAQQPAPDEEPHALDVEV